MEKQPLFRKSTWLPANSLTAIISGNLPSGTAKARTKEQALAVSYSELLIIIEFQFLRRYGTSY